MLLLSNNEVTHSSISSVKLKPTLFAFYKKNLLKYAVKNANSCSDLCITQDYWCKIAKSLPIDKNVSAEHISIRYVIISLQNGEVNLISKLYASIGNTIKIAQIKDACLLLDIVESMAMVKGYQDSNTNYIKSFLQREINKNHALSPIHPKKIDNILTLNTNPNTKNNVLKSLPLFRKIIPIKHKRGLFIHNHEHNQTNYQDYDHKKALAVVLGKTIDLFECNQTYRKIFKLKYLSMDINYIAVVMTFKFNLTAIHSNKIYHAALANTRASENYDIYNIESAAADDNNPPNNFIALRDMIGISSSELAI